MPAFTTTNALLAELARTTFKPGHKLNNLIWINTGIEKFNKVLDDATLTNEEVLLLAETHGLLVGPSTGAAVRAAIVIGQRMSMKNKNIVVIAPSSGVRYLQHPMFRSLRKHGCPDMRRNFELLSIFSLLFQVGIIRSD